VLGKRLEDGAKAGDRAGLGTIIDDYADYLARVKIVYE